MGKLYPNLTLLGITGSIGSGKTTVSEILESWGAYRVSSDELARAYTEKDSPIRQEIRTIFGEDSFPEGERANRSRIAELAFRDEKKKRALESLIHPLVRRDFLKKLEEISKSESPVIPSFMKQKVVAWEVPLLFETDAHTLCDRTLTVYLPKELAWERVQKRGGIPREDFENRWNLQIDIGKKKDLSDFSVRNDTNREELAERLKTIWENLQNP